MIYFDDPRACVIYLKNKRTAYLAVEGYVRSETVYKCLDALTVLCRSQNVDNILFDSSYLDVLNKNDINWITQRLYPKYESFNLQKVAYIKPSNIFGQLAIKSIFKGSSKAEIREFQKFEDAEKWIYDVEKPLKKAV